MLDETPEVTTGDDGTSGGQDAAPAKKAAKRAPRKTAAKKAAVPDPQAPAEGEPAPAAEAAPARKTARRATKKTAVPDPALADVAGDQQATDAATAADSAPVAEAEPPAAKKATARKAAKKAPATKAASRTTKKAAAPAEEPTAAEATAQRTGTPGAAPAEPAAAGPVVDPNAPVDTPSEDAAEAPAAKKATAKKAAAKKTTAKKTATKKTAAKKSAATAADAADPAAEPAAPEPATPEAAASPATAPLFQAPEAPVKKAPAKRTRKKAAPAPVVEPVDEAALTEEELTAAAAEAAVEGTPADEAVAPAAEVAGADTADEVDSQADEDTDSETDSETDSDDESEGSGGGRRRRRRGGRRRRRSSGGSGGEGDDAEDGAGASADGSEEAVASSDGTDAATTDEEPEDAADEAGDGSGGSSSSRRRRRRRRAGDTDGGSDAGESGDPANTVTRVRKARSIEDEITAVSGSTRLEAKKQRRREGREAGRRRVPIVSEAEFLARRESVERVMVVRQREELTQIGVLEDKVLVEHYVARESQASMIGNVYVGRVQNVLPSMEAAFIDIGKGRNAVLYAGEVNWSSLGHKDGQPRKIESVLSSGQSILVQVTKDPVGQKGARLTSQVSLAGRFLVYVPDGTTSGISRKLPDTERGRLKSLLKEIVPDTAGVIVRTAAEGASEDELTRDVERLKARWEDIEAKAKQGGAPKLLYGEPDLTLKVVRDLFTEDFAKLVIQGDDAWETVQSYVAHVAPDLEDRLERYDGPDVFTAYRVDEQIAKGLDRKVWLPSGGSLVIDRTEAMTVVDVNTGKFTGSGGNLEETVTKNNLEAAEEIVRQLRLRDIGGIIVVDFIDMVLESNRDLVLRRLVECLGRDRTRHQVAEVTSLGLVQMTRKRIGTGLLEAFSENCEHCAGRGIVLHDHPVEPKSGGRGEQGGGRGGNGGGNGGGGDQGEGGRRGRGRRGRGDDAGQHSGHHGGQGGNGDTRPPSPKDVAAVAKPENADKPALDEPTAPEPTAPEPEATSPVEVPVEAPVEVEKPVAKPARKRTSRSATTRAEPAETAPQTETPVEAESAKPTVTTRTTTTTTTTTSRTRRKAGTSAAVTTGAGVSITVAPAAAAPADAAPAAAVETPAAPKVVTRTRGQRRVPRAGTDGEA